jgi:microcin C transport system substrate-binding protein
MRLNSCLCVIWTLVLWANCVAEPRFEHGVSSFGDMKYAQGFAHFDYVNPDAPKGGSLVLTTAQNFNSFTPNIGKGINPPGMHVIELAMLYDPLFWPSDDEPGSFYGNLVESVALAPDYSWAIFRIRPEARWHDGTPVTARDVQFTFDWIAADGAGGVRQAFQFIESSELLGEREIRFRFKNVSGLGPNNVMVMGKWPIVPEHYWRNRDMTKTTLEPPLGSGPYRIADFQPGRFIEYERVPDYWGRNLGIHRGRHNFDTIRYEVYRDATIAREALNKGLVDFRAESDGRYWTAGYDIPAVRSGWLLMRQHNYKSYVGFRRAVAFNTRQEKLSDRRVRQALSLAYDYEWASRTLHHDLYERPTSYFPDSYLAVAGPPTDAERRLLEPFRALLPPQVFTDEFRWPHSTGFGANRGALIAAVDLLAEAGWHLRDGGLVDAHGQPFELRFVVRTPEERRTLIPYVDQLERIGVRSTIRMVEPAQYINILNEGRFDVVFGRFGSGITPEFGLRGRLHSASATSALTNAPGIDHPAVDQLLEHLLGARTRQDLTTAAHALDRVLLWNFYYVPLIPITGPRVLYWDKFGMPEQAPEFRTGFPDAWWWDEEKALRIESGLAAESH